MQHVGQTGRLLFQVMSRVALAVFAPSAAALEALVTDPGQAEPVLQPVEIRGSKPGKVGIGLGAVFAAGGTDFTLYYRPGGSSWVVGYRYYELEEDFLPDYFDLDSSDRETRTVAGPFARYLFEPGRNESYYVGAGLYRVELEFDCEFGSDSDAANGLFLGGGLMGGLEQSVGYDVGFFLSPSLDLDVETPDCENLVDWDYDAVLGIFLQF